MRFQTTKRMPAQDPDRVLRVLEGCLRSVSNEIVREGGRIKLFGLGPSPRAVNPRDTTVIHVDSQDGITTLHADVSFQASAFLGAEPQDAVVKDKLDRVFEEMRMRLGFESWLGAAYTTAVPHVGPETVPAQAQRIAKTVEEPAAAEPEVPEELIADPHAAAPHEEIAAAAPVLMDEVESPAVVPESPVEIAAVAGAEVVPESTPGAAVVAEPVVTREPVAEPAAAVTPEVVPAPMPEPAMAAEPAAPVAAEPVKTGERQPAAETAGSEVKIPGSEARAATTAAFSAAVAGSRETAKDSKEPKKAVPHRTVPLVPKLDVFAPAPKEASSQANGAGRRAEFPPTPRSKSDVFQESSATKQSGSLLDTAFEEEQTKKSRHLMWGAWAAAAIVLIVAPAAWLYLPSHISGQMGAQAQPTPAAAPAPKEIPQATAKIPGADEDPKAVVQDWEAAMESNDAANQAAFYADPMDRYFLRSNVSREQVKADKQSSIEKRKDGWALKMEQVKVTRSGSNSAKVRLIKHFTVREKGKLASEWFVPSALQLIRRNGKWQITSERDLGWASSLDELED